MSCFSAGYISKKKKKRKKKKELEMSILDLRERY